MAIIDLILNVAAVLLWLNWRSVSADPLARRTPLTLVGTLKGARPGRFLAWQIPATLAALILLRAVLYWQVGPSANWVPRIDLFFVLLVFRADHFSGALLFSAMSFLRALVIYYFWVLALVFINRDVPETETVHRLLKAQLGALARWPRIVQLLVPIAGMVLLWGALHPLLAWAGIVEKTSILPLIKQGLLVCASLFMSLKFLLPVFLLVYLVLTYVYLGQNALLEYVGTTASRLALPFKRIPLSIGRIDLAPVLSAIIILLLLDALPRYIVARIAPLASVWPQ